MRRLALLGAATVTGALALTMPTAAGAATSGTTNVTFSLTGGSLTISTPSSATLTSGGGALTLGTGSSVSGALGTTTVTDNLGALLHTDTVTMQASDFTDGTGDTIGKANATGYSGVATSNGTLSATVPTTAASPASIGSSGGATILTMTGVVGSASASYNPTVTVSIPSNAVAGTYSGTITQTVSSG